MSNKQYYFISYVWRKGGQEYQYENEVVDIDPLEELLKWEEFKEDMKLIFYREISKEQYEMLKGNLS